jgi:tetratricopeptide (TPR) repeat protein
MDFGLAKIVDETADSSRSLTETGLTIGTPAYMSPEQCLGQRVDARTDVYAIGCILYEAITGKKAFDGKSFLEIMNAHLQKTPATFTAGNSSEAERSVEAVLMKAMEHDRDARYQSIEDLLADLTKLQQQEKISVGKTRRKKSQPPSRKNVILATASGVMLAAAVFIVFGPHDMDLKPHRAETYDGETLAELTRDIEEEPDRASRYLKRGILHQKRDERDNAIEDYSKAIELDPSYAQAYDSRAEMYVMINQYDKALQDASTEIKLTPDSCRGWAKRARIYYFMDRYADATADAKQSLKLEFNEPASFVLADCYTAIGDLGGALQCLNRNFAAGNSTADERYWNNWEIGTFYFKARMFDKAIASFNSALSNHNLMSQAWGDLAAAYGAVGDMPNAERAIKNTLALDLFPARAYRLKGEMYRAAGKWAEAVQEYSTSTSLEPWFGPGFEQRAYAEIAMGQMTSAHADLQRCLKSMPYSARALSALAMVEDQLGKTDDANTHIAQALAMTPVIPDVYLNRARMEMHAGDFVAAMQDLNRAIDANPRFGDAYATRAIALSRLGRNGEAEKDRRFASAEFRVKPFAVELKVGSPRSIVDGAGIAISRPSIEVTPRADAVPALIIPEDRLVALAASDIWLNLFTGSGARGADNRLALWPPSAENRAFCADQLDAWGITDEATLRKTLVELSGEDDDKSMAALNHVRAIALCRMAYMSGFISEDESWKMILPISASIRKQFDSWEDLSSNYSKGRVKALHPEDQPSFEKLLQEFLSDPASAPKTLRFKN